MSENAHHNQVFHITSGSELHTFLRSRPDFDVILEGRVRAFATLGSPFSSAEFAEKFDLRSHGSSNTQRQHNVLSSNRQKQ